MENTSHSAPRITKIAYIAIFGKNCEDNLCKINKSQSQCFNFYAPNTVQYTVIFLFFSIL